MRTLSQAIIVGALCFSSTIGSIWADTYYVDVNNLTPSYPYATWATAATSIQDAVNAAASGDEVLVTNGVYDSGTTVTPGYSCLNRVVITNDIIVQSVNGPQSTFIIGQGPLGANAVRGVYMSAGLLAGFTITNGHTLTLGHNFHDRSGGGVDVMGRSGVVSNCVLTGNSANIAGGGICLLGTLINCVLTGNSAGNSGGGSIYGTLNNCTITANSALYGGGSMYGTLTNCIVFYNTARGSGDNWNGSANFSHCCTTPDPGGMGNITTDPLFVAASDFHLLSDSPCINAGTNLPWMEGATDLDGKPRIIGGAVDIGAYEYGSTDTQGPPIVNLAADPNPVPIGMRVLLEDIADDSTTGSTPIGGVQCRIDSGEWLSMVPSDGAFDSVRESAEVELPAFVEPGLHTIQVSAWDAQGNLGESESMFLPVYDPSGGFVTGGGWIQSPPNAFHPDLEAYAGVAGKATFGFVSKYQKGANVPTGNTEFQFKAGELNFKSTEYQWLVIAGARAQFKGWGTVNGMDGFGFMLTAIDGDLLGGAQPDRFRIKIWLTENNQEVVIYDNQAGADDAGDLTTDGTVVHGGSVVVHKK